MDKVEELRKQLRDERNGNDKSTSGDSSQQLADEHTGGTGTDTIGHAANESTENGSSLQHLQRQGNRSSSTDIGIIGVEGRNNDKPGSPTPINFGKRSANRRPSENRRQSWTNGANIPTGTSSEPEPEQRRLGNLTTDDYIPPRTFSAKEDIATTTEALTQRTPATEVTSPQGTQTPRKRGRPPKQRDSELNEKAGPGLSEIERQKYDKEHPKEVREKVKPSWFLQGPTLSVAEMQELEEPLKQAIEDGCGYIDKYLWAKSGDTFQQPIWSDLTPEEITVLTRLLLKQGKRSPAAAQVTRAIVSGNDYVTAITVLMPRLMRTYGIVGPKSRKRKKDAQSAL